MFWLFSIWSVFILFPVFLAACFVSFFLPGYFVLKGVFIHDPLKRFVTSIALGIVLWGIQGYVFGYAHVRFLTYVYVVGVLLFFVLHRNVLKTYMHSFWKTIRILDKKLFLIIALGILVQLIPVAASGIKLPDGIHFYSI